MPTTPIFSLRYPTSAFPADVPTDMTNLATDVDNQLNSVNGTLTTSANSRSKILRGNILVQAGSYLVTSGATELALPKLSLTSVTAPSGWGLVFAINLRVSGGAGGYSSADVFEFRVRQTTAVSGTLLASARFNPIANFQNNVSFALPWITTGSIVADSFHLSVARVTGGGTIQVESNGGGNSSFSVALSNDNTVWSNVA